MNKPKFIGVLPASGWMFKIKDIDVVDGYLGSHSIEPVIGFVIDDEGYAYPILKGGDDERYGQALVDDENHHITIFHPDSKLFIPEDN